MYVACARALGIEISQTNIPFEATSSPRRVVYEYFKTNWCYLTCASLSGRGVGITLSYRHSNAELHLFTSFVNPSPRSPRPPPLPVSFHSYPTSVCTFNSFPPLPRRQEHVNASMDLVWGAVSQQLSPRLHPGGMRPARRRNDTVNMVNAVHSSPSPTSLQRAAFLSFLCSENSVLFFVFCFFPNSGIEVQREFENRPPAVLQLLIMLELYIYLRWLYRVANNCT